MENQQLDPLTSMVEAKKKKRKRILKIVLGIIGGLFLIAGLAGFFLYRNGRIEGKWESPNLASEMKQAALHEVGNSFEELQIKPEELVGETGMTLEVKDNKAVVTLYYNINKDVILAAYNKAIQDEYNKALEEAEQEAATYGVDRETFLKETIGDDYESKIKATIPKPEKLEKQFDSMMTKEMKTSNGQYNPETGQFSTVFFEGKVDPLTHTLQVTAVNPDPDFASVPLSIKKGDRMLYTHSGDTLTFIGGEQYPFKLSK